MVIKTHFPRYKQGFHPETGYVIGPNGDLVEENRRDLTGMKFGHLTVIARVDDIYSGKKDDERAVMWAVKCDCGLGMFEVWEEDLLTGRITQCNCCREKETRCIDETGHIYGKLVVMGRDTSCHSKEHAKWICRCTKCGKISSISGERLRSGIETCGCDALPPNTTHGLSGTGMYVTYNCMHRRCEDKKHKDYPVYSKKGIKVCPEWHKSNKDGLKNFCNWAIENGYDDSLTIDRKDNDGDYEPGNCKFSNSIEQANNKSTNVRIEYNGETHTLAEWSRITGIPYETIRTRHKKGLPPEKILENN